MVINSWNFHIINPATALIDQANVSIASVTTYLERRPVSRATVIVLALLIFGFNQQQLTAMDYPSALWDAVIQESPDPIKTNEGSFSKEDNNHQTVSEATQEFIIQEFRYYLPEAGEVMLVWGGDDWAALPEEIRPSGTFIENNVMHLAMTRQDDIFTAEVFIPVGVTLNYGFQIRKTQNGADINWVWDGDYQATPVEAGLIEIKSALKLLATQEIRYRSPEAGEVFLVWGINNWQIAPEGLQPPGTVIKEGVMRTPMTRQGSVFTTQLQIQTEAMIDYGFLVTQTPSGADIEVWDAAGNQSYQTIAVEDDLIEIQATPDIVRQAATTLFDIWLQWQGFLALLIGVTLIIALSSLQRYRHGQSNRAANPMMESK